MPSCRLCSDPKGLGRLIWEFPKIRGNVFGVLIYYGSYNLGYDISVPGFRKLPFGSHMENVFEAKGAE